MNIEQIIQNLISGVSTGSIYIVVGLGFMIIYRVTRVINFTQGEFVMLGGMLTTIFYSTGIPLLLAIILAVLITALLGVLLYYAIISPIRSAPTFTLILVTFGASIVIRGVAVIIWGTDPRILPAFSGEVSINFFGALFNAQALWVIGTTAISAAGLYIFFYFTVLGKAVRACALNTLGATLMGIRIERMGAFAFGLAAGLGALSGAVLTPLTTTSYDIGLPLAVKGFIAALIGGLSRIEGVIVGGLVLGVLEALGAGFIHSGFKDAMPLVLFLGVLYFRRGGLLGDKDAGKV